jgi:hypothetical protein
MLTIIAQWTTSCEGNFFLAGAEFRYTDIPFGMFRQHQTQKSYDILRQTRSILETAARLTLLAPSLSEHANPSFSHLCAIIQRCTTHITAVGRGVS